MVLSLNFLCLRNQENFNTLWSMQLESTVSATGNVHCVCASVKSKLIYI